MRIFGWCQSGFHADYEGEWSAPCKGSYRKRDVERTKRGRKVIEKVLVDEVVNCDCPCHQGKPVGKRKPTNPKRKKK